MFKEKTIFVMNYVFYIYLDKVSRLTKHETLDTFIKIFHNLCVIEFSSDTQRNRDGFLGERASRVEQVDLSSGNEGQVAVQLVFSGQAQFGVVVDLESESSILVKAEDTSDLESVWFVVVGSV